MEKKASLQVGEGIGHWAVMEPLALEAVGLAIIGKRMVNGLKGIGIDENST